jgi:hypothetical protein
MTGTKNILNKFHIREIGNETLQLQERDSITVLTSNQNKKHKFYKFYSN